MIKPEELALIKGYTMTKEGILLNRNGKQVKGRRKDKNNDYLVFDIRIGPRELNKKLHCKIHRFQAYLKYGDEIYKKGIVVRHLNGDRHDNSFDNIAIGTNQDNKKDIPKELIKINCGQISRKYSQETIENIRKDKENGHTYRSLMSKYNISSKGTIWYILHREDTLYKTYPKRYRKTNNQQHFSMIETDDKTEVSRGYNVNT